MNDELAMSNIMASFLFNRLCVEQPKCRSMRRINKGLARVHGFSSRGMKAGSFIASDYFTAIDALEYTNRSFR